ncbi:MAG: hypothetical protein HYZ23_06060, partial [Chloroflexi bacterium]|nr:hypothetical protein [Chloroflexota bacterium]
MELRDLSQILLIARRWAWLLVVGLILGAGIAYGSARLQTPIYQANTRVIASRATMQAVSGGSTTGSDVYYVSEQVLMQTFIELLKSSAIFEKVTQTLGYPVSPKQVVAGQVGTTRILSITVEDPNPQRAADIANAMVQALIEQNDEIETGRFKAQSESLQSQIKQVEEQIAFYQTTMDNQSSVTLSEQLAQVQAQMEPLQTEIIQLQKDIAILTPARSLTDKTKLVELEGRLSQIQPLVKLYQEIYTNLVVMGSSGVVSSD